MYPTDHAGRGFVKSKARISCDWTDRSSGLREKKRIGEAKKKPANERKREGKHKREDEARGGQRGVTQFAQGSPPVLGLIDLLLQPLVQSGWSLRSGQPDIWPGCSALRPTLPAGCF